MIGFETQASPEASAMIGDTRKSDAQKRTQANVALDFIRTGLENRLHPLRIYQQNMLDRQKHVTTLNQGMPRLTKSAFRLSYPDVFFLPYHG